MKVKEEYSVCDRCKQRVDEHWGKHSRLTKYKKRLILAGHVFDDEIDLCSSCEEKFQRFMLMDLDDDKPTIYELRANKKGGE